MLSQIKQCPLICPSLSPLPIGDIHWRNRLEIWALPQQQCQVWVLALLTVWPRATESLWSCFVSRNWGLVIVAVKMKWHAPYKVPSTISTITGQLSLEPVVRQEFKCWLLSLLWIQKQSKCKEMYCFHLAVAWHRGKLRTNVQTSALLPIVYLSVQKSLLLSEFYLIRPPSPYMSSTSLIANT